MKINWKEKRIAKKANQKERKETLRLHRENMGQYRRGLPSGNAHQRRVARRFLVHGGKSQSTEENQ